MFLSRKKRESSPQPRGLLDQARDVGAAYSNELSRDDIEVLRLAIPGQLLSAYLEAGSGHRNVEMIRIIGVVAALHARSIEEGHALPHMTGYNPDAYWNVARQALPGLERPA